MLKFLSRYVESQFQHRAEMNGLNALTSFVAKYIPDLQVKIQSLRTKNIHQQRMDASTSSTEELSSFVTPPLEVSHSIIDRISGLRIVPIYLKEAPSYTSTPYLIIKKIDREEDKS